jgi:energy-coupling factor transport system permease protein
MSYRRRASPLHATGAACACSYCLTLALAALLLESPLLLASLTASLLAAGYAARVGAQLRRALMFASALAVPIVAINALVARDGLTVIARLGDLPLLGRTDVTLEAVAYGGVLGLRAAALIMCGALYTAAVDPDQVLRLFRRLSFHSALTATLATRMVPVLARDSRRLADAQRCRPGRPPSRVAVMRAVSSGVLDRALDVAAALEVRGYGSARRPPASRRRASRHDLAFGSAAILILMLAIVVHVAGLAQFRTYPTLRVAFGPTQLALAVAFPALALLPFLDRRGIGP